jgi:nitrogen fixation NifU-like protein
MEDQLYREIILEHWERPQNYGVVEGADFSLDGNNPLCGDQIRLTGKVLDGVLTQIAFEGEGCAISRAAASVYTEKIKGMSLDEISKISPDEVLGELGVELTPARMKCALLVYQVMRQR